ncbi:hypothetical protein AQUCO_00200650v1 [Aquilegia coerulea]|uniref:Subtilisin-like protease n=1 Tax=Aquilegia coerulea TaxID=218851 RepID=A0A2G5F4F8_AQUCA|nr:hypothetical protein AQUCO_00200650v1 [Aquilegia coerulea]
MEKIKQSLTLLLIIFFMFFSSFAQGHKNYIVHVSKTHKPPIYGTHHQWYISILTSLPPPHDTKKLLYTYQHSFHGFVAHLTETQALILPNIPGILKVAQERTGYLHTTRTPDFLGLTELSGLWTNSNYGEEVIIGVLDTGVWPESESFNDDGLSPVPEKWKGECMSGPDFPVSSCNKKLIGAKFFVKAYEAKYGAINDSVQSRSPRDTDGHGTHTASIAAGSVVKNAGYYDLVRGEARGIATKARVAVYKICWAEDCAEGDILAALEQAVDDGVDIISISIGRGSGLEYDDDAFAIGALRAVQKGILVTCSAGNDGLKTKKTPEHVAPWILTVGASSIDRDFRADVILGDGTMYRGVSLYSGEPLGPSYYPLVYAGNHGHRLCAGNSLSKAVKGKIVLCDGGINSNSQKARVVKEAGGVGMILANNLYTGPGGPADEHVLPATMVDPTAGNTIRNYIKSQPSGNATIIFKGMVIGGNPTIPAPLVAQFSSRGPNRVTPEILKPDLIAPGVNILASWTGASIPPLKFNISSGTSMACPHVSGIAALLRKAYPEWSPAAIKSALMTTAYNADNTGKTIRDFTTLNESTPFDRGSGHVDPNKALDPGLVYDLGVNDYIGFLCSIGYTESRISVMVHDQNINCSTVGLASPGDLNYPSFSVVFKPATNKVTQRRVVKNVGKSENVVYDVKVSSPPSINIDINPSRLVFSPEKQILSYEVTFTALGDQTKDALPEFGWIEWSDGFHRVRSPVAFTWGKGSVASI